MHVLAFSRTVCIYSHQLFDWYLLIVRYTLHAWDKKMKVVVNKSNRHLYSEHAWNEYLPSHLNASNMLCISLPFSLHSFCFYSSCANAMIIDLMKEWLYKPGLRVRIRNIWSSHLIGWWFSIFVVVLVVVVVNSSMNAQWPAVNNSNLEL